MIKLQSFYVFKISTSHLKRKNYDLQLSISDARRNGEIVSLGDSQALRSLRKLKGVEFYPEHLQELQEERKKIKRKKSSPENIQRLIELDNEIDNILFVPEIVSVFVENVKHYEQIGKNGFYLNGVLYKRLACGAGQARRNNALFISTLYEKPLKKILNNDRKEIEIVPAKHNAYFSLATSSSIPVSEPYFAVVPDKEVTREELVDFVEEQETGDDTVTEKKIPITFNLFDGQGIISPRKAKEWADELGLDYVPSNFIIRGNFLKGMVCVVDFHQYGDEIGEHFIYDVWGQKVNSRDLDVIFTASQFKLWSAFESCSDYIRKCRKNDWSFSITRVSPKTLDNFTTLNYQFVQVLSLEKDDIERLCQKTVDYFENIIKNKDQFALFYLFGKHADKFDESVFEKINDNATKAILLNKKLIKDPYVRNHLISSLNRKIRDSYVGTLYVDGNYSLIVADPYAFLEYIFDQPITGLLSRDEHYSRYWLDRKEKQVSALRAPLTVPSEIVTLNLKENEETEKWYEYLNNCIIFNVFGNECLLAGGAD